VVGRARRDRGGESATTPPEVEFRGSPSAARGGDDPVRVFGDAVVRGSARCGRTPSTGDSFCACRLPLPGELGRELAATGSRGVYAPGSSVSGLTATSASSLSTSLTFALPRPSADDEDLRTAGLDGTEAEPDKGDDGDEETVRAA